MAGEKIGAAGSTCTPRSRPRPEALKAELRRKMHRATQSGTLCPGTMRRREDNLPAVESRQGG